MRTNERSGRWTRQTMRDHPVIVAAITPFKLRKATNEGGTTPIDGVKEKDWHSVQALRAGAGITEAPIDYTVLDAYLEYLHLRGAEAILIAGTTGEASTLGVTEQKELIKRSARVTSRSTEIIAGTGSNDTATAIDLVGASMQGNAAAVILKPPYYNRPELRGIRAHFRRILEMGVPTILYDIPQRTGQPLDGKMIVELAMEFPNFLGVKVEGDIKRYRSIREQVQDDFSIFATDGNALEGFNAKICNGIVTVMGNIVYDRVTAFIGASPEEREAITLGLEPLSQAINQEIAPQGIKYALQAVGALGKSTTAYRLPLTCPERHIQTLIDRELASLGLIKQRQAANA